MTETKNFTMNQSSMFDETVQLLAASGLNLSLYTHIMEMNMRPAVRSGTLLQALSSANGGVKHYGSDFLFSVAVALGELYETFLLDDILDNYAGPDGVLKLFMHEYQTNTFAVDQAVHDIEAVPMLLVEGITLADKDISIDASEMTVTCPLGGLSVFRPFELVRFDWDDSPYDDANDAVYYRVVTATDTVLTFDRVLVSDVDVASEQNADFLSAGIPVQIRAAAEAWQPGITERVVNGSFAVDSGWTEDGGALSDWSTAGGVATASNATGSSLDQDIATLLPARKYEVIFTIATVSAGSVAATITDTPDNEVVGTSRSTTGTFREVLTTHADLAPATAKFEIDGTGFTGVIDNVSVKEIHVYGELTITANNGSGHMKIVSTVPCFSGSVNDGDDDLFTAADTLGAGSSFYLSGFTQHDGHYRVHQIVSTTQILADRISPSKTEVDESLTNIVITITNKSLTTRPASGVVTVSGRTTFDD